MDRRKLIAEVFDGLPHERLPRAVFGGGLWALAQTGLTPADVRRDPGGTAAALAELYAALDTDILCLGSGLNSFPAEAIGAVLRFADGGGPALERPLITSMTDLGRAERTPADLLASPGVAALVNVIEVVRRGLPDRFVFATSWGPFTWGMILCEHAFLRSALVSDRPFVRAVAEFGGRLAAAWFDLLIDRGLVDGICVPDGGVTLISPEDYRDLVLPAQQRLMARARGRGVRSLLHMCGRVGPQLDLYALAGADGISVDCTVGIREAWERYHDTAVTAGNVDAVAVLRGGDAEAVAEAVDACVGQVPDPRRRYVLMPSCDLPRETPRANVEAFLRRADSWSLSAES